MSDFENMVDADCDEKPVEMQKMVWRWLVFGVPDVVFHLVNDVSWGARFWTKVFLNSKWERVSD